MRKTKARPLPLNREWPTLDERRCNGCGWCVRLCPTDCLTMSGPLPFLARSVDCNSCGVCVLVCPTLAIAMAARAALT
ncbi:MAG TPA: 4Fe-4S binding protein [Gemmataceae bacterium]|nr:4Fe-4S binding protein [Gemmataceae bacterium]